MQVQSLSVVVPSGCPNDCKYCVSKLHQTKKHSINRFNTIQDYKRRLSFARDNGCNTLLYTGAGEPICNPDFLTSVASLASLKIRNPFNWVEIQTSGSGLNKRELEFLRAIQVNTISLSLSSLDDEINADYNGIPEKLRFNIKELCDLIKSFDFNLRLCLNLTDYFNDCSKKSLFEVLTYLNADQVTFRKLFLGKPFDAKSEEINDWINQHSVRPEFITELEMYIEKYGRKLERLPYGNMKYSVNGISAVIDKDCMSQEAKETIRYLILKPNGKLYTKWDDKGSLLF